MSFPEDRDALVGILQFVEKLFDHYISRLSQTDRNRFETVWNSEVRPQLQEVVGQLQAMASASGHTFLRLKAVGLTDASFALKRHYLAQAAKGGFRKKLCKRRSKNRPHYAA